ncbi:MAG: GNAT family N-acetyltransferase [Myxococcales bacterium]
MNTLLHELEETVVDAWPAAETEELAGWLLRKSGGPSHRANSVATLDALDDMPLPTRIARVEAWYREHGQLPMFQVGPCASPAGLDAALEERGYLQEGAAAFARTTPAELLERLGRGQDLECSVSSNAKSAWLQIAVHQSRFASSADVFKGILARLGSRARFALARDAEGEACAAALAIASEDRLGIYAMFTLPHRRRKGAGKGLLRALAQSARADAMRELYLLVELGNVAARGLYQTSGFEDVYQYAYRVFDDGRRGATFC